MGTPPRYTSGQKCPASGKTNNPGPVLVLTALAENAKAHGPRVSKVSAGHERSALNVWISCLSVFHQMLIPTNLIISSTLVEAMHSQRLHLNRPHPSPFSTCPTPLRTDRRASLMFSFYLLSHLPFMIPRTRSVRSQKSGLCVG